MQVIPFCIKDACLSAVDNAAKASGIKFLEVKIAEWQVLE